MLPFLLGQAFLGGKLGVSQGEDDPLTRVARASRLQLARLLQGFDAGLPVACPVMNPAQGLPRHSRVWSEFDGLAEGGDGVVQLALGAKGVAKEDVGFGVFRIDLDGLAVAGDSLIQPRLIVKR